MRRVYHPLQIRGFHVLLPGPSRGCFPPRGGRREAGGAAAGGAAWEENTGDRGWGDGARTPHTPFCISLEPQCSWLLKPSRDTWMRDFCTHSKLRGQYLSSGVISFCLFILLTEFLRQEYWSGLPFPSPVDHILSELFTMTHLSWVALHDMAHIFTELRKPL